MRQNCVQFFNRSGWHILHFDDFNFAAARTPILKYIDQGIEIIPVSSKTKLEIEQFCDEWGCACLLYMKMGLVFLSQPYPVQIQQEIICGTTTAELMQIWLSAIPIELRAYCQLLIDMDSTECTSLLGLKGRRLSWRCSAPTACC